MTHFQVGKKLSKDSDFDKDQALKRKMQAFEKAIIEPVEDPAMQVCKGYELNLNISNFKT